MYTLIFIFFLIFFDNMFVAHMLYMCNNAHDVFTAGCPQFRV